MMANADCINGAIMDHRAVLTMTNAIERDAWNQCLHSSQVNNAYKNVDFVKKKLPRVWALGGGAPFS